MRVRVRVRVRPARPRRAASCSCSTSRPPGLHFEDVAKLLVAFRKLLAAGHSLLVIEHNLDVIRASDWIVDLGPEGGDAGGEIVCEGTPEQVMHAAGSHTGQALRDYAAALERGATTVLAAPRSVGEPQRTPAERPREIVIHNAREHNLHNIDVRIPHERFTVLTGVSGSGKSTLAFDILFNEGQRRYLESLNAYARQFVQPASRPEVDAIFGIPPTVAIEQRTSRGGRKSTVATLTEVYHFLRLLYVKLGTQHCPDCDIAIEPQSPQAMLARILREYRGTEIELLAPLIVARKGLYTALAKWAAGKGYAHLRVDGERLPVKPWPRLDRFKEHSIELPVASLAVTAKNEAELRAALESALEFGKGVVQVLPAGSRKAVVYSTRRACPGCGTSFAELDPRLFSFNSKHGWCTDCFGTGLTLPGFDAEATGEESAWLAAASGDDDAPAQACSSCAGTRLNPIARHVRFRDQSIAQRTAGTVERGTARHRGSEAR